MYYFTICMKLYKLNDHLFLKKATKKACSWYNYLEICRGWENSRGTLWFSLVVKITSKKKIWSLSIQSLCKNMHEVQIRVKKTKLEPCDMLKIANLRQYGLWRFQTRYTKLERFLHKNQHTQRKLLNFEDWCNVEVSKIGHQFRKWSDLKIDTY